MSPYDQDIHTLETWIENRRILIAIRYIDKFSIEHIERDGIYKTGIKEHDRAVQNQLNEFYEKPLEIIRLVCEGKPVVIRQPEDSKWLYEVFNAYMLWWKKEAVRGIHTGLINAELMIKIDEFLGILFPYAHRQKAVTTVIDIFNIGSLSRMPEQPTVRTGNQSLADGIMDALGASQISDGEYVVKHESYADVFEKVAYDNYMRKQKNG